MKHDIKMLDKITKNASRKNTYKKLKSPMSKVEMLRGASPSGASCPVAGTLRV